MVGDRHGLVEGAVLGEDPLQAEAGGQVQAVVVGLLEVGHPREVVLVVAVRRGGRPVALRGAGLGDEQGVGDVALLHRDRVDVAGLATWPRVTGLDAGGADHRRPARPGRAGAVQTARMQGVVAVADQAEPAGTSAAVRRGRVEDVHAVAELAEVRLAGADARGPSTRTRMASVAPVGSAAVSPGARR